MMKNILFILSLISSINCMAESRWEGSYYKNHSDMQFGMAVLALTHLKISPNAQVLDIGSGDGRVSHYVASLVPEGHILGLDRSESMVATAQSYANSGLSFVLGDADNLQYEEQFDCVVSFNCLHWVADIQIALKGIHNALVPGGQALILIAPVQARHCLHRVINQVAKSDSWRPYFGDAPSVFTLYTFAEWAVLIEKSGLIPESLQLVDASLDYPDEKVFAEWVAGWIPFGTIPVEKRNEYVQDVVKAYIKAVPCEADGTVHFQLDELVIVAAKPEPNK